MGGTCLKRLRITVLEHPPVRFGRIWSSSFGAEGFRGQPDTHTYIQTDRLVTVMTIAQLSFSSSWARRGSRGGVRGVRTPPLVIKVLHFYCKTALSQRQSLRRCPLRMPFEKTLNPPLQEILDPRLWANKRYNINANPLPPTK